MKKEAKKSPFFAKLLEKQVEKETVKGGGNYTYKNNKRDWDESLPAPTLKYPSDADEEYTIGWP